MVDYLYNCARFFAHESCGQCTPCREGTAWIYKTMKRIKSGGGRIEDLDIMLQIANNMGIMPGTTICGLADGAAWPDQERPGQVPSRARRVYPNAPGPGPRRDAPLQQAISEGRSGEPTNASLAILPAPSGALRSPHGS